MGFKFNNMFPKHITFNNLRVGTLKYNNEIVWQEGLPDEYTQLEYIASTGTQYIDTGLVGKPGYTIEATVSFSELSNGEYQYFAGYAYTGSADRTYFIRINNSSKHLGYTYGTTVESKLLDVEENVFYNIKSVMKANKQEFYVDGKKLSSSAEPALAYDDDNPNNIYMFVSSYVNNKTNGPTKARCKEAKWYDENDNLVRHFVPCYRNNDNEIGMYDLVLGDFYTNQGEGEFVKSYNLPSEYQAVEYIEGTGTQYFEIDYIATGNTVSQGKYQITNIQSGKMLFGCRQSSSQNFYGFNWGGGLPYKYYNAYVSGVLTNVNIDEGVHKFKKDKGYLYRDDILINSISYKEFTTPYKMIVFGCKTAGVVGLQPEARIFNLQFYDSDILKIDLIPCYRKSDGEIGMYDLVNSVFYTNDGTGTFLKGNNV